jgi:hypothetical protein
MNKAAPYDIAQRRRRLALSIVDLLVPSALGLAAYLAIFVATLIISQPFPYKDSIEHSFVYSWGHTLSGIVKTQAADTITLYAFWIVVALLVYLLGKRMSANLSDLAEDISLRSYIWPQGADRNSPIKEFIERAVYRLAVAAALLFYLAKTLPALSMLWRRSDLVLTLGLHCFEAYLLLLVLEVLFLHGIIIFIRLFALRRRLVDY